MQSAVVVLAVGATVLLVVAAGPQHVGAGQPTPLYLDSLTAEYGGGYGIGMAWADDDGAVARRELGGWDNGRISYGTLGKDYTPCSIRGAPYGNCNPGAVANQYNRGCSAIARCRG